MVNIQHGVSNGNLTWRQLERALSMAGMNQMETKPENEIETVFINGLYIVSVR